MRLHLNKTLRAALVAAISAVGFTVSSASAADVTLANVMNKQTDAIIWGENGLDLTSVTASCTTAGVKSGSSYTQSIRAIDINIGSNSSNNYTYTLNFTTGTLAQPVTLSSINVDFVTFNGNNQGHNQGAADYNKINCTWTLTETDGGTLQNVVLPDNGVATKTTAAYTHNQDGTYTPAGFTGATTNIDFDDITLKDNTTYTLTLAVSKAGGANGFFVGIGNIALINTPAVQISTWNGTAEHSTWGDTASWSGTPFVDGGAAVFDGNATIKTATVDTDVTADSVTVSGAAHTFELAGGNLTTGKLTVGDGGSLTLAGTGTVTASALAAEGKTISLGKDVVLTGTGSGTLAGTGTYVLASGATSMGDVTLDEGWAGVVRITDASLNGIDLSGMRNAQSTVELKGLNGWTTLWEGTNDYNFKLTNGSNGYAWQNGAFGMNTATHIMEFSGVWSGDGLFLETGATEPRNMHYTYSGNITAWTGEFRHDAKQDTNLTFKGSATDVNIVIGMGASSTGVFNVVAGTEDVTFNKAVTANKLTIDSGASATLKDQADFGTLAAAGTLTVDADTHTVTIGGGSVGSTIDLQAGTLTLTGAYNISDINPTTQPSYVNGDSPYIASGNGFKHTEGTVHVVSIQDGAVLNASTAEFTYGTEHSTGLDEHGDFTLAGSTNYSTLYVNNNDGVSYSAAWDIAQAQTPAVAITSVVMAADTTLTADKEGASIALSLTGATATVNATAATTISGISGWSHELTIGGTAGVTIAGQTLTGTQKLVVDGIVSTTGALTVNNADASLVVNENATLNINGNANLSPVHGSVQIDGTVNISHELDLSKGKTSNVQLGIGSTGKLTAWGMWMHSASAITLAEDGELTIGQNAVKDLTIIGKADSGITYLGAAGTDSSYGTNNENYKITNATVNVTGANVTLGNTLSGVDVFVDDGSNLTLNTDADSVTVNGGGTFTLNEGKTVATITVKHGGTIAGGVDATDVGIEAGATATFNEGVTDAGVTFGFSAPAQVTNNGGETAVYGGIGDEDMQVAADALVADSESAVSVANSVDVVSIANYGEGALTLTTVNTQVLEEVDAMTGDISLQNTSAVSLTNMTISSGTKVSVYTDEQATTEGTVTITESLVAGGGTLLANLELADGSMLDVNGGDAMALTLGSEFNLAEGAIVTLDNDTLAAIANLENIGDTVILVKQYQDHALITNLVNGDWSRTHFDLSSITDADYKLFVTDSQIGLVKFSNTPEPTTGTLSLLALAALAARRRKH